MYKDSRIEIINNILTMAKNHGDYIGDDLIIEEHKISFSSNNFNIAFLINSLRAKHIKVTEYTIEALNNRWLKFDFELN